MDEPDPIEFWMDPKSPEAGSGTDSSLGVPRPGPVQYFPSTGQTLDSLLLCLDSTVQ